jgi:hypothetical protein
MIKFIEYIGMDRLVIARQAKQYLEDIEMYIKNIYLTDIEKLPDEKLQDLHHESLFLVVTLADINDLIKEQEKERAG